MAQAAFVDDILDLAEKARPFNRIQDAETYEQVLSYIETLMAHAADDENDFLHHIIHGMADAVEQYENQQVDIKEFEKAVSNEPADVAMLRLLMSQHNLKGTDLPEIGSKSNVSLILHGKRELTKEHIRKLSGRFGINPALFFNYG